MPIANVTLNDTFAEWVVKTNQLISQSENNYTLSVSSYNAVNSASFTAANIAADVLSTNSVFILNITDELITSNALANNVLANTLLIATIYDNANLTSNAVTSNILNTSTYIDSIVDALIVDGQLSNTVLSNTTIVTNIYDNSNTIASAFQTNSNLGLAWTRANVSLANTDSYNLVIDNLTITGNLILSGVLDLL